MEDKISQLIKPVIYDLGYELVKVSLRGRKIPTLELFIERSDGQKIQVGDCQKVSRNISAILDVEDKIPGKYFLEVASAGIERPLVNRQDYIRFVNHEIKVRLKEQQNGKLTYKGKILGLEGECVVLKSKNVELRFEYNNIKSANLILTDAMFKELLKGIKK